MQSITTAGMPRTETPHGGGQKDGVFIAERGGVPEIIE
jgi:hypothetical protein